MRTSSLLMASLIISVIIVLFAIFNKTGYRQYKRIKNESVLLRENNAKLLKENERLILEIENLKNNDKYIERIARNKFGLVHKDETVVLIPK